MTFLGSNDGTTITLLDDIDVIEVITVPKFKGKKTCTVDGNGHMIRQAYAGRMFSGANDFTYLVFKNVTILGGGETYRTDADSSNPGVVFYMAAGDSSSLTFDSGCVISNFVYHSILIGGSGGLTKWDINVKPGSVIACNRAASSPGLFSVKTTYAFNAIRISGGEIFGNVAPDQTLGYFYSTSSTRTMPMLIISGGRIHDNVVTSKPSDLDNSAAYSLFIAQDGPCSRLEMTGGEIYDNDATPFVVNYNGNIIISGGKIYGNEGYAVQIYGPSSPNIGAILSGDAVIGGNGATGNRGAHIRQEFKNPVRIKLGDDFTGFAQAYGNGENSQKNNGALYGTNLASYVGAENIHLAGSATRVLQTDAGTGELRWGEPDSAKIGETWYATLAAALAAATDGTTVQLMRDCIVNASIVPPANKAITVNGGGHRVFRCMKDPLVKAATAGGNLTFTNVELNEGYFTSRDSYTNHVDGVLVNTLDGVAATVTLGSGVVLSGGCGTNALVRVANGATVNFDGCVITGVMNRAVAASTGGTLGVKGATIVKENVGGDIDVADGNILSLNGDLTGSVHVTVAGEEACAGQRFGTRTADWNGIENFINGGDDPKIAVSKHGALVWLRPGFMVLFK